MYETVHQRKDGSIFPVEISVRMVEIGSVRHGLGIVRDITERKAHECEIERLNRLYATLSQINQSVVRVKTREQLFQEACEITVKFGRFQLVWIGRRDPKTQQVIPVARASKGEGYLDEIKVYADDRLEGRGPTGTCIREKRKCIFNDFQNDPAASPWHEAALAHNLRAAAALPIHFKGEVWGTFTVYDTEAGVFQDKEVALLEEAVMDISYAMESLDVEAQRLRAEEALGASDLRYRRLFEAARDGVLILDAETGMVVDVNPFMVELLGYSREAFLGKKVWELGFLKDLFANQINFTELQKKEYIRYEDMALEGRDGRRHEVEFVSNVYQVNHHKVIQCNIRDISARKQAEAALRQAEEKYRGIFENAIEGIYQSSPDGKLLSANPAMAAIHGYDSPEEFIAAIRDISHQLYVKPGRREEFKRLMEEQGQVVGFENLVRRKDGRLIWITGNARAVRDDSGKILFYEGTVQDITAHKQVEESLRALSSRHEAILAAVPEIIVEVDANKTYVWMNQAGIEFFGDDAMGKEASFYFEGPQDTYNVVQPLFVGHTGIIYVESWQRRGDGEKRLLAW
jgi:PAS domain S-box-containing protein